MAADSKSSSKPPRLSEVETDALGPLLEACERYCSVHSENRAPVRAVKYALEQREFLTLLADAVAAAAAAASPQVQRVVCLGGVGLGAVAARRKLPPKVKIASVQPTTSQDTAWQMLLARLVAFANGIVNVDCLLKVPSKPWDLLVVEGLDTFVLADGALKMAREAARFASPTARVIPEAVSVKACLCAPRDFSDVAKGFHDGFDLRAVCGREQLAATVPWLVTDEDNALLEGCTLLTEPFEVMGLWDARPGGDGVGAALAAVADTDHALLEVAATQAGTCMAVLYWWEAKGPSCSSGVRALQWLSQPRCLQAGEHVKVTATRSLTRLRFMLEECESPRCVAPSPSLAALRHCPMLRDSIRNEAYGRAIEQAIRRIKAQQGHAAVFEIGSGTGLMTMMAKRAGADRVTGCEVDPHVRRLASQVASDNSMPFGGPNSDFHLLPLSFQAAVHDPSLQGQFNILVAELMDDSGLGERMWPFFALARQHLLNPNAASAVVPRRLTIFALLVTVEIQPIGGVQLWPLDPFWHCSTVPGLDAIGRQSGTLSLDMDSHEHHWQAMSNVVEVLSLDLACVGPDSVRQQQLLVPFQAVRDGAVNGVVWFWHAELDDELSLVTAPRRLCEAGVHALPSGALHPSRHCWKQACQVLGPLQVASGQQVQLCARHDTVSLRWDIIPNAPPTVGHGLDAADGAEALLHWWQAERGLSPELLLDMRDFVQAWLKALASQEGSRAEAVAVWRRGWFEASDQAELLELFDRLGDFGIHPTTINFLLPLFFGSVTSGAKCAE
mmetsp:Transcript_24520/g.70444  ORF Transcript_24520/g.70444 Transcript_24520/m.70444 type:complete len:784 (+) Transcript_24520:62-2413(+)